MYTWCLNTTKQFSYVIKQMFVKPEISIYPKLGKMIIAFNPLNPASSSCPYVVLTFSQRG